MEDAKRVIVDDKDAIDFLREVPSRKEVSQTTYLRAVEILEAKITDLRGHVSLLEQQVTSTVDGTTRWES